MSIPANDRIAIRETSAGQLYVETDFQVDAKEYLRVERLRAGVAGILVLDVDYTVSLLGSPDGCRVTFTPDPALEDDKYALIGVLPVGRTSSFVEQGGVSSASLDAELDTFTRVLQESSRDAGRAFKTSVFGEDTFDFEDRRLQNVGDPVAPGDAVNLESVQGTILAATAAATATAVAAADAATSAAGTASGAADAASSAAGTASGAAGAATSAAGAAANALSTMEDLLAQFPPTLVGLAGQILKVRDDELGYDTTDEIEGGGGGGELDALFLDQRITTLIVSDVLNVAIFSGPDGSAIHDHFDTLTYVDVGGATNLDTSEPGCLKPAAAATTTLASTSLATNQTAFTNYNHRMRVAGSQLSASGSAFRLTLVGVSSGTTAAISGMYAGHKAAAGDAYDFDGTQVQVTVGGNAAFNVAAGATVVTDWIPYTFDDTKDFVIAFHTTSGDIRCRVNTDATNYDWWTKAGSTEVSTANVTGYSQSGSYDFGLVSLIEVQSGLSNLSVRSQAISASEQPAAVRAVVLLHDAVGITLNTDTLVDLSRDGGATWATATLIERYAQPGNVRVLDTGNVDVSGQPAGSSMRWRWRTANAVAAKNLGTAMWGTA